MASEWHPCTRWARTPGLIKGHFLSTWSFQLIKPHKVNTCFPYLGTRKLRSKGLFPGSRHWRQQSGFQPSGWLQSPGPPQASAPCTSPGGQGRLGGAAPLPVTDGRAVGLPGLEAADPSSTRADSRPSQQPLVDTVTIWGGGAYTGKHTTPGVCLAGPPGVPGMPRPVSDHRSPRLQKEMSGGFSESRLPRPSRLRS